MSILNLHFKIQLNTYKTSNPKMKYFDVSKHDLDFKEQVINYTLFIVHVLYYIILLLLLYSFRLHLKI